MPLLGRVDSIADARRASEKLAGNLLDIQHFGTFSRVYKQDHHPYPSFPQTPTMHPTIRKRVFSLDTDPVTNAGLVDESTTTSPPKKRSKTAMKKEVANDKQVRSLQIDGIVIQRTWQVRFPLTSKHDDDDDISMPYTPIRAAKSLPASHSDDEYKEPSPSPKPKSVKKAKKAAGTKNKSPKSRKAAVPKPPKISAAERKALWVDWCIQHAWPRDPSYNPRDGERWYVMHGVDGTFRCLLSFPYNLYLSSCSRKVLQLPTRCRIFLNEKDVKHPGRARCYSDLLRLAHRKAAYFKGHHPDALGEPGAATEQLMLDEGETLFIASYVFPRFIANKCSRLCSIQRLKDRYTKMQDKKIQEGKMDPSERKERPGPKVFNTRYLPPPMDSDDENEDEIEHDDEYDSDL